jgi:hypothetical protein
VLFLHQTLLEEKYFPVLQLGTTLQVLLALVSKPGWLVLFPLVLIEGELRLSQLVGGVGLAHLPTLVLPMAEAQWRLRDGLKGLLYPSEFDFNPIIHFFLLRSLFLCYLQ